MDDTLLGSVCSVIDAREKTADQVEKRLEETLNRDRAVAQCNLATPFNIEGAVSIEQEGGARVWTGLRSPLLPTKDGEHAILLRLADLERLRFDAGTEFACWNEPLE